MAVAKKLEGNASHPISQGALCPRGQASIQITYHPDRLIEPLKRRGSRGSGDYQPITWDAAIAELVSRLDAAPTGSLAALTRPGASSRNDLFAMFLEKLGGQAPIAAADQLVISLVEGRYVTRLAEDLTDVARDRPRRRTCLRYRPTIHR